MDLALRVPKFARIGRAAFDIVKEHNEVVAARGRVALGKFGAPLSKIAVEQIRSTMENGSPQLYVVMKDEGDFYGFAATIGELGQLSSGANGLAPTMPFLAELFPAYYSRLDDTPSSYLILTSELRPVALDGLILASNDRPLLTVLHECRTAVMVVYKRK